MSSMHGNGSLEQIKASRNMFIKAPEFSTYALQQRRSGQSCMLLKARIIIRLIVSQKQNGFIANATAKNDNAHWSRFDLFC